MSRRFTAAAALALCLSEAATGRAQTAVLLAASDPAQVSEVLAAKVMADDGSLWLSVRLKGSTRLAIVTSRLGVDATPSAEAWLRALDFGTRMRVGPPSGSFAECGAGGELSLADSGLPEPPSATAQRVWDSDNELELRRSLADAALNPDLTSLARFTARAAAPFRVFLYEAKAGGASTSALRFGEQGHPLELPSIDVAARPSVPITLIALAPGGVLPIEGGAEPSEFPVTYRGGNETTDYAAARATWRDENPGSWLSEAQATSALFAWTVFPAHGQIAPVSAHFFDALAHGSASGCEQRVETARASGSVTLSDYVCDGADDLADSLRGLNFGEARLSRLYGSSNARGGSLRVVAGQARNPRLLATDFDSRNCPIATPVLPMTPMPTGDETQPGPVPVANPSGPASEDPYSGSSEPAYQSDGSCTVFGSTSDDSCSGDSTSDTASNDSCSGDSTSDSSSDDSCSGDSSSDDSGPDTCSGDSSHSSSDDSCSGSSDSDSDSSGCGKSDYDGDTCSGSSSSGEADHAARSSSAALGTQKGTAGRRPRPVRLSLLTLLAAALALPLRRLRAWR